MSIKVLRLIEFLVIGVVFGVMEDLMVIRFVTHAPINLGIIWLVFLISLPFAFLSEVVVDHPRFWEVILRKKKD